MRSPPRHGPWSIAVPALLAAGAALVLPGAASGSTAAAAACLAVGALALLAGHTWGLLVLVPAHAALAGRLWPEIALAGTTHDAMTIASMSVVLVTLAPTIGLSAYTLPGIVATLLPDRGPRTRALVVAAGALCLAAALIVPAFRAPSSRPLPVERAAASPERPGEAVPVHPRR